jgi:putative ABC transport system ATP-binding protein
MVLECRDLRREYRRGAETIKALDGVDVALEAGELVALVGPSGSGKTTLMNLVGLLDRPSGGELILAGQRVDGLSRRQRVRERRRRIGFVFQNFYLLPELRAWENVGLPMLFDRRPGRSQRARELLERVGLGERMNHLPSELSGGEMQRVAIARALANEPPLILADEPTGKLDSANGDRIAALLKDLAASGVTVLMATHDMELAATADRIIALKDGRIRAN